MPTYCPYCMHPASPGQPCPGCGADPGGYHPSSHHFPMGRLLHDRYLVGKALGEGGFGITYLGLDTTLKRRVAIKEYFPNVFVYRETSVSLDVTCYAGEKRTLYEKGRNQFLREAQVLAQFDNFPEVVHVLDFFQENNTAYIVMELLTGDTLRAVLSQQGRIPAKHLFEIMEPVVRALNAMHGAEIIHRDISPDNIMLLNSGQVKLLDFGCARDVDREHTMTVMLKHGYAPIEQYTGYNQGPWTDVYALCATFYHCLTGKTPPRALERMGSQDPLIPPNHLGAALTPERERAIIRGLAVEPKDRWQSMAGLYAALYNAVIKDYSWQPGEQETEILPETEPEIRWNPEPGADDETTPLYSGPEPETEPGAVPEWAAKEPKRQPWGSAGEEASAAGAGRAGQGPAGDSGFIPGQYYVRQSPSPGEGGGFAGQYARSQQEYIPQTETAAVSPARKRMFGLVLLVVVAFIIGVVMASTSGTSTKKPNSGSALSIRDDSTISAGELHTVAVKSDGTVVAVGDNEHGQCDVGDWTDIVAVSAGDYHTVGLRADGTVVAVGSQYKIEDMANWTDIVAVSAGSGYTVGLKSDGTVVAAGSTLSGKCDVGEWTNIVAVSAGSDHTVGLKSDGTVAAVGANYYGQCDVGEWTDIVAVSAGGGHTVGLKSDGTVVAVGFSDGGQCDVGEWTDIVAVSAGASHTVGLKSDGTVVAVGWNSYGRCDVEQWTGIVTVSAGSSHTVGLRTDGTVAVAGDRYFSKCDVGDWTDIAAVSTGENHTVGLRTDGTVVAVGVNEDGQCDVGDWTDIVAVSAGWGQTVGLKSDGTVVATGAQYKIEDTENWTDIVAVFAGTNQTVGLKSDGTVVVTSLIFADDSITSWTDIVAVSTGQDFVTGLKSDGTVLVAASNSLFKEITDCTQWTDIAAISMANFHGAGLKSDGTVVTVGGGNGYGQHDVSDWTDIVAVSAGDYYTIGLKSDGTVLAAGDNEEGQCNVGNWTDITAVSASVDHTVGLKSDGTVVATGGNNHGQCDVYGWTGIRLPANRA